MRKLIRNLNPKVKRKILILPVKLRASLYRLQGKEIIYFLHIGKTGGTSLKFALKNDLVKKEHALIMCPHAFTLKDVPKGEKVIFFVRDPIRRFISSFYSRKRQGKPYYYIPWSKKERFAFSRFSTANDLANAIKSKNKSERESARNAMKGIFHVNTSFWDWFYNEKYFLTRLSDILFVGTQENLKEDFKKLKKMLSIADDVSLPSDPLRMHKTPEGVDKDLDKSAKKNLRKWYASDYEFLELLRKHFGVKM